METLKKLQMNIYLFLSNSHGIGISLGTWVCTYYMNTLLLVILNISIAKLYEQNFQKASTRWWEARNKIWRNMYTQLTKQFGDVFPDSPWHCWRFLRFHLKFGGMCICLITRLWFMKSLSLNDRVIFLTVNKWMWNPSRLDSF
jgi:hypothetical protein